MRMWLLFRLLLLWYLKQQQQKEALLLSSFVYGFLVENIQNSLLIHHAIYLFNLIAARSPEHLAVVTSVYKQFYGRDLVEVLDKETSGHFGRALHYLILPPIVLDAELIYQACIGAGTNERVSSDLTMPLGDYQVLYPLILFVLALCIFECCTRFVLCY